MLTGTEAVKLLRKHLKNKEAREHSVAVAKIMEELATRLRMNPEEWQLCGLLHDLDHEEIQGDMSKHGLRAAELLEGHLSRECLQAIRTHDHRMGIPPRSIIDKALIASDAVTRFLSELKDREADKLPRLNSEIYQTTFEEKAFRKLRYLKERIEMCREIGVALDDFLSLAQDAFEKKDIPLSKSNLDGNKS
jgi:putative nucleotidyltransferase with HDIG domain